MALISGVPLNQRGALTRLLSTAPLAGLGRISYGVYLWHWPAFLALNGDRTPLTGTRLFALRCGATLALATGSWFLVGRPVLRWRPGPVRILAAVAVAASVAAAAITAIVAAPPAGDHPPLAQAGASGPIAAVRIGTPALSSPARRRPRRPRPHGRGHGSAVRSSDPLTVDVFGDSIAWTMMLYLPATPRARFIDDTVLGCGIVQGGPYRYFGQTSPQPPAWDDWPRTWAQDVAANHPDELLLLVGRRETMDRVDQGQWTGAGLRHLPVERTHRRYRHPPGHRRKVVVASEP